MGVISLDGLTGNQFDTSLAARRGWIQQHHDRAGDIELVRWSGATPDEWMP